MKTKLRPLDVALNLYQIAGPIFVTLREQARPAINKARAHPDVGQLTFTQLRVLLAVQYGKDQVGKLARSAQVAQPAMSKIVAHLVSRGFARRLPDPVDRRRIRLRLTAKGTAITAHVLQNAAEKYVDAIQNLSPSDRQKLIDGIAVIFDVIETTRAEDT